MCRSGGVLKGNAGPKRIVPSIFPCMIKGLLMWDLYWAPCIWLCIKYI